MSPTRRRTLTGTVSTPASSLPNEELAFRADLIHPPQSQVVQYSDSVSDRIVRLDISAQRMAEGFGVAFTSFVLNPIAMPDKGNNAALLLATLQSLTHKQERITLERRNARWGLYYMRSAPAIGNESAVDAVPLRDAPLDVRERFLTASEAFFREYLQLCEHRLGRMKKSIQAADRTIELLAAVRLT